MKIIKTSIIILLFLTVSANARVTDDLRLGAYPASMGGAFVAMANGYHSLYWNPAGLARFNGIDVSDLFIPSPYGVSDITENYIAAAYGNKSRRFGTGLSMRYLGADLEYGSSNGSVINTVGYDEYEWILGGGVRFLQDWTVGLNYKHYSAKSNSRGTDLSVSGSAMDIGTIYYLRQLDLNLGAMVRNFSADVGSENVDPTYRVGVAKSFVDDHLRFALDVSEEDDPIDNGNDFRFHAGGEFLPVKEFAIRVGYDDEDITGGFGIFFGNASLEYAYVDNDRLDGTHQVSISYRFGLPEEKKEEIREEEKPVKRKFFTWRKKDKEETAVKEQQNVHKKSNTIKQDQKKKDYYFVYIDRFVGTDITPNLKWLEMAIQDILKNYISKNKNAVFIDTKDGADYTIDGTFKKLDGHIKIHSKIINTATGNQEIETSVAEPAKIFIGVEDLGEKIIKSIK